MSLKKAYFLIFIILLIDQISKIYIKTHFELGEEVKVFNWSHTYTTREFDQWRQGMKDSMVIPIFLDVAEEVRLRNLE